jgi:hypothetical protein
MSTAPTLPLTDELLLLMLDDENGKLMVDSTKRKAGMAGAAVLQLVLDGALDLEPGDPKKARLVAVAGRHPASPVLAEALERAAGQKPKGAVARIGGASDWKHRAGDIQEAGLAELVEAGIVELTEGRTLGVFPTRRWVLRRPEVEREITDRIAAVLDGAEPDQRTAALVTLAGAVDVLPKVFPDLGKKAIRSRVKDIESLRWGGEAVMAAVNEVQAAVVAAIVATTVATSGSS